MLKSLAVAAVLGAADAQSNNVTCSGGSSLFSGAHSVTLINGTSLNLSTYNGRVLMVTIVASF